MEMEIANYQSHVENNVWTNARDNSYALKVKLIVKSNERNQLTSVAIDLGPGAYQTEVKLHDQICL